MGGSPEVTRIHDFLSNRNISVTYPNNPDLTFPGISSVQETHRESDNPDLRIITEPVLLVGTRSYRGKLAIAMEFGESGARVDLSVRRHGTYKELSRWRRRTGTDWPEYLAEIARVDSVFMGKHGMSIIGTGYEGHFVRVSIDLANGRVRQTPITHPLPHSLAA